MSGSWGSRIIENPFPVYRMIPLRRKDSKPEYRRIIHDFWRIDVCIWSKENGDYEEQPQTPLGVPLGDS